MVQWKGPQRDLFVSADDDDDDIMSNMSDSEEEDPNTLFTYKPPPAGEADKCCWCAGGSVHSELCLVTHDRLTKSFCSEECQQLYKNSILNRKVCEWCRQHFPNEPRLIVVEPSLESVPLQFCTQSCINKYKMELFCEEVKEQLRRIKEDNVQLPNAVVAKPARNEKKILITPELWSKGEPALVFIDEFGMSETANPQFAHHNGNANYRVEHQESNDRKRKGTKMENVISKLSRRQFPKAEYEMEQEEEITGQSCVSSETKQPDGQSTPINLSVYRTGASTGEDSFSTSPTNTRTDKTTDNKATERPIHNEVMTASSLKGPMIVPVPIFIPVPIPIPIPTCLTALSHALIAPINNSLASSQKRTTPMSHQRPTVTPSTQSSRSYAEKRYILRKQLASDDPE